MPRTLSPLVRLAALGGLVVGAWLSAGAGASADSISGVVSVPAGFSASAVCVNAYRDGGGQASSGFAGADGAYRLDVFAPGTYTVAVNVGCPGGTTSIAGLPPGSRSGVVVAPGQDVTGIDFSLVVSGSAQGRVRVPAGFSQEGICVFVSQGTMGIGLPGRTDARGVYTIGDLPPGTYRLQISADAPTCSGQKALKFEQVDDVAVQTGQTTFVRTVAMRELTPEDFQEDELADVKVAPLKTKPPVVTERAVEQQVAAPIVGTIRQTGTAAARGKAGKQASLCVGTTRVRRAGAITAACRLTAAGRAARAKGVLRMRIVTLLVGPDGAYRSTRTVVIPQAA